MHGLNDVFFPFNDVFINVWSWTVINSTLFYKRNVINSTIFYKRNVINSTLFYNRNVINSTLFYKRNVINSTLFYKRNVINSTLFYKGYLVLTSGLNLTLFLVEELDNTTYVHCMYMYDLNAYIVHVHTTYNN